MRKYKRKATLSCLNPFGPLQQNTVDWEAD